MRKQRESISEYIATLCKLSEHCKFGESLNDMLRDRIVCGCKDKCLQCKLLAETDLDFEKALKIAQAMETAEREAKDLQSQIAQPPSTLTSTLSEEDAPHQGDLPGRKGQLLASSITSFS